MKKVTQSLSLSELTIKAYNFLSFDKVTTMEAWSSYGRQRILVGF